MVSRGFVYDVDTTGNDKVVKVPRSGRVQKQVEETSCKVHRLFLGNAVPETKFIDDQETRFKVEQKKIHGNLVDISLDRSKELHDLLKMGQTMQEKQKILFDIFGMQGMISLFNYFFDRTIFKSINDRFLPLSEIYLRKIHNFPPGVLAEMNKVQGSPFIAHNLIKDAEGNYHFVDTDYRLLDIGHPLNLLGDWITKKALKEVERLRPWDIK